MTTTLAFDILARDRASDKFDKVGRSASGAGDKLKKFAKVGAAAAAAGAVVAGKALFNAVQAAGDLGETVSKTTAIFGGKNSKMLQIWAEDTSRQLGLSKQATLDASATFGTFGKAAGKSGADLRIFAQQNTTLAADLASFNNTSPEQAIEALGAAFRGEAEPLRSYGVLLDDASMRQQAMKMGLIETTKNALTPQQKVLASQALILKQTSDAQGDFTRTSGSLGNQQKIMKAELSNVSAEMGAKLLPFATKLVTFFNQEAIPAFGKVGDWFKSKILPPIRDFAEKAAPKARDVMEALKGAFKDSKPFLELVGKVITNVVVPGLKKLLDVAGPMLVGAIKLVGKGLEGVGKAGTWMWNNALQPAFKFIAKGIGTILDGWSSMLGAMGKVPGFGWAKDASVAMGKAADKAYAVANGLEKIKSKKVTVTVVYAYQGKRSAGKEGSQGPGGMDFSPRAAADNRTAAEKLMEAIADGMKAGGKKVDQVLSASRDRIKDTLSQIRSDMASMSESIASALNPTDFGSGLTELMASLTGNNGALSGLTSVFAQLKGSVSKDFLSALMQSGNVGLATQLANDPAAAAEASRLFDANAALAGGLGDQTAQAVLGDKIEAALKDQIGKLLSALRDEVPDKQAKKIRRELEGLRIELNEPGKSAGRGAHVRGAW